MLKYGPRSRRTARPEPSELAAFMGSCGLTLYDGLKKVKVESYCNGISVRTNALYELIDYVDDDEKCVLSKGKWYRFNKDYLEYLAASLNEIETIYEPKYDYSSCLPEEFIQERYDKERMDPEYHGLDGATIKQKLGSKYYRERAFNLLMSERFGFECHDRESMTMDGYKIEVSDLYAEETLLAVKIGNASSALCYAIEQSTTSLRYYRQNAGKNLPAARRFGVWLVLARRNHLKLDGNGKPNINELRMISLKNRLDVWKKEVRLQGCTPIIRINYYDDRVTNGE